MLKPSKSQWFLVVQSICEARKHVPHTSASCNKCQQPSQLALLKFPSSSTIRGSISVCLTLKSRAPAFYRAVRPEYLSSSPPTNFYTSEAKNLSLQQNSRQAIAVSKFCFSAGEVNNEDIWSMKYEDISPKAQFKFALHSTEKKASCENYKPLMMRPNRFMGKCILSFAYSK